MKKVVAFDFGGVYFTWDKKNYIKSLKKITRSDDKAIEKAVDERSKDVNAGRMTQKEYWKSFCDALGKTVTPSLFKKITLDQQRPITSMKKLVRRLRKKYKVVLLTNHTNWLDDLDRRYRIYREFDIIINSHTVKMIKPNKNIYRLLIKKSMSRPGEIVFIDDKKENTTAARRIGIKAVLFTSVPQLKKDLVKMGVRI